MARSKSKYDKLMSEHEDWSEETVHFVPIDLNNAEDIRNAANTANDWAGGCADILVNNGKFWISFCRRMYWSLEA